MGMISLAILLRVLKIFSKERCTGSAKAVSYNP